MIYLASPYTSKLLNEHEAKREQYDRTFQVMHTVVRLKEKGINYTKRGTNFIVNGKEINVRGCDINNKWAQKTGPGWNRLNPLPQLW